LGFPGMSFKRIWSVLLRLVKPSFSQRSSKIVPARLEKNYRIRHGIDLWHPSFDRVLQDSIWQSLSVKTAETCQLGKLRGIGYSSPERGFFVKGYLFTKLLPPYSYSFPDTCIEQNPNSLDQNMLRSHADRSSFSGAASEMMGGLLLKQGHRSG